MLFLRRFGCEFFFFSSFFEKLVLFQNEMETL